MVRTTETIVLVLALFMFAMNLMMSFNRCPSSLEETHQQPQPQPQQGTAHKCPSIRDTTPLLERMRQEWSPIYLGDNTILCRIQGYRKMFLDTRDVGITPHLCTSGEWERWIELLMWDTIEPDWNVMDVGANFGFYTLLMAGKIESGRGQGIAIEAVPRIHQMLSDSVEINGYSSYFKTLNVAVSNKKGVMKMEYDPHRSLNANLNHERNGIKEKHPVWHHSKEMVNFTVETQLIDDIVEREWGPKAEVNFMKIDVEGAEGITWFGMQKTLKKHSKKLVIFIEVNTDRLKGVEAKEFYENIRSYYPRLRYIAVGVPPRLEDITIEQLLSNEKGHEFMLYLSNKR